MSGATTAGVKQGATKLGIAVWEYAAHLELGERWCSTARHWVPGEEFGGSPLVRKYTCRPCGRVQQNIYYHRRHPQAGRRHCIGCRCEEGTP